jgi:hypothetical protein
MTFRALDGDALRRSAGHARLRLALPWIRSMPLACIRDLTIRVDGDPVDIVVLLGDRRVTPGRLGDEVSWWYLQDRLVLELPEIAPGAHTVAVSFDLEVPYLSIGPDGPLRLPIRDSRELGDPTIVQRPASRDVA